MANLLSSLTTDELGTLLASDRDVIALLPVGSVEPHGPHLPLATDTMISVAVAERAADQLEEKYNLRVLIAPSLPYGVTDFAAGFAGAVSVPAAILTGMLSAIISALVADGFKHVCLINNHLEPDHDAAVRAAAVPHKAAASVACPLTRRWGRTLSAEYKSGACHAGQYETSLILAASAGSVRQQVADTLPALSISLARAKEGMRTFKALGIEDAYTGAPAAATAEEGELMLERLTTMVVSEVSEALGLALPSSGQSSRQSSQPETK